MLNFIQKDRVKDNRTADFAHKSRQEKRSEHKHSIRIMGCKENKPLIKYHRAEKLVCKIP